MVLIFVIILMGRTALNANTSGKPATWNEALTRSVNPVVIWLRMKALFQAIKFEIVLLCSITAENVNELSGLLKLLKLICFFKINLGKSPISIPHPLPFLGFLVHEAHIRFPVSQLHFPKAEGSLSFQRWQRTDTDTPRRTKASCQASSAKQNS